MRRQKAATRCVVAGTAVLIAMTGACGDGSPTPAVPDITPGTGLTGPPPSPVYVDDDAMLAFTHTVLVPGARVLGSFQQDVPKDLHAVVVEVEPNAVNRLLAASGFVHPLVVGKRVLAPPVPGYPPGTGERIASGGDRLTQSLVRQVLVDRTDPDRIRVHVWAYSID